MDIQAAVARAPHQPFSVENVTLDDQLREDELLVRLVATGMCHTDLSVVEEIMPVPLPMVLGHEGAGIVERVGSDVTKLAVGDHVVLTFMTCGECRRCESGHPAYCDHYGPLNFAGRRTDGTPTIIDANSEPLGSAFYTQSSFATYAVAREGNAVKVRQDAPIELLGPLACGLSTGAGTVLNVLKPQPHESIAIFGTGALGSAAIMAAKYLGVSRIVAIDRVESRLELARELGATHTINTASEDLVEALAKLEGIDYAIDTSGVPRLVEAAVNALAVCGTCVLLGASHDHEIKLSIFPMISGRKLMGVVNGDCEPHDLIPKLVDMYMAGDFPIDRLSRFYSLNDINQAVADAASGASIKPILRF